jgi:hypothetical protein
MDEDRRNRRLIATFILALALFHFPLLEVAEAAATIVGLPAAVVYLFGAWAAVILVLMLIVERRRG